MAEKIAWYRGFRVPDERDATRRRSVVYAARGADGPTGRASWTGPV